MFFNVFREVKMNQENKHKSKKGTNHSLLQRVREKGNSLRNFLQHDLWHLDVAHLSKLKTSAVSFLRIITISVRDFIQNNCYMQAGALTYLTLLSLVPILALMFSVSKGLGAQELLMQNIGLERRTQSAAEEQTDNENILTTPATAPKFVVIEDSKLAELPDEFANIAITVFTAVERTNVKTLGVLGIVILIWTVIRMMGKMENTFNNIWNVDTPRTLTRRFSDYISIIVVVPILILCATSINAFLSSEGALALVRNNFGVLSMVYVFAIRWSLSGLIILAFVFLLIFMPNTRVRFTPALIGGFITGIAWFSIQNLYFMAQSGVTQYNAIYGTFAALPFFLVWLHSSWLIILFGAVISFAVQNFRTYHLEENIRHTTPASLTALAFLIMCDIAKKHISSTTPWSSEKFAVKNEIPQRLAANVIQHLHSSALIRETADMPGHYLPGRDISRITVGDIKKSIAGEINPHIRKMLEAHLPNLIDAEKTTISILKNTPPENSLRSLIST